MVTETGALVIRLPYGNLTASFGEFDISTAHINIVDYCCRKFVDQSYSLPSVEGGINKCCVTHFAVQ